MNTPAIVDPGDIDPARLKVLLERAGWVVVGQRPNAYWRIGPPRFRHPDRDFYESWLTVPANPQAPDFRELMASVVSTLQREYPSIWSRAIQIEMDNGITDTVEFRRESKAPAGTISWNQGQELVASARLLLAAGAKSCLGQRRYFSNTFAGFANRYIDSLLMGQTSPGSFVVRAYVPVAVRVPKHAPKEAGGDPENELLDTQSVQARKITVAVAHAVEATTRALSIHRRKGGFAAFDDGVESGISADLLKSLSTLVGGVDEFDLTIRWDPVPVDGDAPPADVSTFRFLRRDAGPLESAAIRLASEPPEGGVTVAGRVHLLTRKKTDGPAVFGVETADKKKYRVRLADESQLVHATSAWSANQPITVAGQLSKEGRTSWLYDAVVVTITPALPPPPAPAGDAPLQASAELDDGTLF